MDSFRQSPGPTSSMLDNTSPLVAFADYTGNKSPFYSVAGYGYDGIIPITITIYVDGVEAVSKSLEKNEYLFSGTYSQTSGSYGPSTPFFIHVKPDGTYNILTILPANRDYSNPIAVEDKF